MITIEAVKCLHGIDEPEVCNDCADLLQIEDGREFLERIGMGLVIEDFVREGAVNCSAREERGSDE